MKAEGFYERVRTTLEADVRRLHGRIQEAEDEVYRTHGTISRLYGGTREIPLKLLLEILCALRIEPAAFFARALGRPLDTEVLLGDLIVEHRKGDRIWREVESATRQLEEAGDLKSASAGRLPDIEGLVAEFAQASQREQMRRLRKTERYRHPAFARAYLRHLDALREEDPKSAYRLAARVAIHLIPAIPGPLETRAALQCDALGVFGSAARLQTDFSTAAQAFYLALQLAERHDLAETRGTLLHRIAHLLEEADDAKLALIVLREALEIYLHTRSDIGLGKTLILQARIYCCLEEFEKAIEVVKSGLRHLPEDRPDLSQYLCLAYQSLASAHHELGDRKEARTALAKASTFAKPEERVIQASLTWQAGEMTYADGDFGRAGELLHASRDGLRAANTNPIQEALVSLGIVYALLKQGKQIEACETASAAARFLEPLEDNPIAKAAILQLARAGINGKVTRGLVIEVRSQLKRARPEGRAC